METLLTVRNLRVNFRLDKHTAFEAVKGISFDIPTNSTVALVGESGSGKSVTSLSILGLLPKENATVLLGSEIMYGGRNLLELDQPELRRLRGADISMIFQEPMTSLNPVFTVGFQLTEVLRLHLGLSPSDARKRALALLAEVGIPDPEFKINAYPSQMSGGQQQRVALARALVRPASLVLLDEPFSALDAPLRRRLRGELRQLQREIATTMVIVTHDPDEAALLGDEILILDQGRVLQTGKTEAVFARPASETVARVLGAENVASGIAVDKDQIEIGDGVRLAVAGPPLLPAERIGWSVRPERIRLSADGRYQATIEDVASLGGMLQLSVRLGGIQLRVLTDPSLDPINGPCRLDIDPRSIQIWKI